MRLPENIGRVVCKAYKVERQLIATLGREPSPAEVAQAMGIEEQTLQEALACEERLFHERGGLQRHAESA